MPRFLMKTVGVIKHQLFCNHFWGPSVNCGPFFFHYFSILFNFSLFLQNQKLMSQQDKTGDKNND